MQEMKATKSNINTPMAHSRCTRHALWKNLQWGFCSIGQLLPLCGQCPYWTQSVMSCYYSSPVIWPESATFVVARVVTLRYTRIGLVSIHLIFDARGLLTLAMILLYTVDTTTITYFADRTKCVTLCILLLAWLETKDQALGMNSSCSLAPQTG